MAFSAKRQNRPLHMNEMMQRLGLDPGVGVLPQWSLSYLTALHRCQACAQKQACRGWLLDRPEVAAVPPSFCPNADIFFEMQMEQPGPHFGDAAARMAMALGGTGSPPRSRAR